MTIFEAYNSTKKKLAAAGIEDCVFEAKQIIKHITGLNAAQIITGYNKQLSPFEENNLTALVHQRQVRYPLQYIFGEWDFYGRPFKVGVGVLVPRADTELLAEHGIEFLKEKDGAQALDLCAGSGCIGITVACECKNAFVTMVEKYDEAMRYLIKNIELHSAENTRAVKGDVFEGCAAEGQYDLILSNPPYIPQSQMKDISPETEFEPETALLAKNDGMEFFNAISENYKQSLKTGGMLAFEVGIGQAACVGEIMKNAGFVGIEIKKDLNGIDRVVSGKKP